MADPGPGEPARIHHALAEMKPATPAITTPAEPEGCPNQSPRPKSIAVIQSDADAPIAGSSLASGTAGRGVVTAARTSATGGALDL